MAGCCDGRDVNPLEVLPAGLDSLPRQLAGFPDIRRRLLGRLADSDNAARQLALGGWRPFSDDFGSMALEVWAYTADILGFYDARVADESYLGTADRRVSLRRLVGLLGYTPRAGVAGSAAVAAIAEGTQPVTVPAATGVRSRSFDGNPPQVFETTADTVIHPLLNSWTVESFRRRPTVDASFFVGDTAAGGEADKNDTAGSGENRVNRLLFLPQGFGLSAEELCLIEGPAGSDFAPQVSRVAALEPFKGLDGKSYTRAALDPPVVIADDVDLSTLRARRPAQSIAPTLNNPVGIGPPLPIENVAGQTRLFLDGPPTAFRAGDPVIVARDLDGAEPAYAFARIAQVKSALVSIGGAAGGSAVATLTIEGENPKEEETVEVPLPTLPGTELRLEPALSSAFLDPERLSIHHGFVEAGRPTNVGRTTLTAEELMAPEGVPVAGSVRLPAGGTFARVVEQGAGAQVLAARFLFADAEARGGLVEGRLTVAADGSAKFQALSEPDVEGGTLRLPLALYGNLLDVTRGQSVRGEVLGSGDARVANQRLRLRKKPLTYLPGTLTGSGNLTDTTLTIRVDGIEWRPVTGFFGAGPRDQVYIVRHDEDQNAFITFGDGKHGARLPSGVGNVVADYRFGAGAAAPPAGGIRQLAGSLKGLRTVRSPAAAAPGADPDGPDDLKGAAPQTALLLGRVVSAVDFAAVARASPGVIAARAEWLWIPEQLQAGVVVHYIGHGDPDTITATLRAQSDPTVPISVTQAQPIPVELMLAVATDSRFVAEDVAAAVAEALAQGVLAPRNAVIGGTFWASDVFAAVVAVRGAVSASAMSFTGPEPALLPDATGGTCIPTGRYLDFSAPGAIAVSGAPAAGLPPAPAAAGAP
jgi:hypothetical protein